MAPWIPQKQTRRVSAIKLFNPIRRVSRNHYSFSPVRKVSFTWWRYNIKLSKQQRHNLVFPLTPWDLANGCSFITDVTLETACSSKALVTTYQCKGKTQFWRFTSLFKFNKHHKPYYCVSVRHSWVRWWTSTKFWVVHLHASRPKPE